jgi:hypothetical protein
MLAPASADWGDDDPENGAKLETYDRICAAAI